jgi:hypothetical protein
MAARARFKKLTDLYIRQKTVDLPDGSTIVVRPLNAFERDECLDAAQVARARVVMALKATGTERDKVEARILEVGEIEIARELAEVKTEDKVPAILEAIRDDPDWVERMAIIERTDLDDPAHELSNEEVELMARLNAEYFEELTSRRTEEYELQLQLHSVMGTEDLRDAYEEAWLDKRGRRVANDEYLLTEILLSTYWPDGDRVFESRQEIKEIPNELFTAIVNAVHDLTMAARDPKDLGSDPSSSDSSPQPSEEAASVSSSSTATPTRPRGTSRQPSTTP